MTARLETARARGWPPRQSEDLLDLAEKIALLSQQRADLVIAIGGEPNQDWTETLAKRGRATLVIPPALNYRHGAAGETGSGGGMRALVLGAAIVLALLAPAVARAQFMGVYDYPFVSPLAATVAATPPANQAPQLRGASFATWSRSAT